MRGLLGSRTPRMTNCSDARRRSDGLLGTSSAACVQTKLGNSESRGLVEQSRAAMARKRRPTAFKAKVGRPLVSTRHGAHPIRTATGGGGARHATRYCARPTLTATCGCGADMRQAMTLPPALTPVLMRCPGKRRERRPNGVGISCRRGRKPRDRHDGRCRARRRAGAAAGHVTDMMVAAALEAVCRRGRRTPDRHDGRYRARRRVPLRPPRRPAAR